MEKFLLPGKVLIPEGTANVRREKNEGNFNGYTKGICKPIQGVQKVYTPVFSLKCRLFRMENQKRGWRSDFFNSFII